MMWKTTGAWLSYKGRFKVSWCPKPVQGMNMDSNVLATGQKLFSFFQLLRRLQGCYKFSLQSDTF